MKRQVIVIGLGRFGSAVTKSLCQLGHQVLAVDRDESKLNSVSDIATHVAQADGVDRMAMEDLGVRNFDIAIVAMSSNAEASILTTLTLKEMGVPYVIARASSDAHAKILDKIGADKVVFSEQETAVTLAHTLAVRNAQDYLSLGADFGVAKLAPPPAFVGRTLDSIGLVEKYGIRLIALCRTDNILLSPRLDEVVRSGDLLVVAGRDDALEKLSG